MLQTKMDKLLKYKPAKEGPEMPLLHSCPICKNDSHARKAPCYSCFGKLRTAYLKVESERDDAMRGWVESEACHHEHGKYAYAEDEEIEPIKHKMAVRLFGEDEADRLFPETKENTK